MDDYSVFVEPIVKAFERFTEKLTNEDIAEYIDYISEDQKVALNVAAGALEQFCLQNTAEFCESWICASSCQTLQQLTREIDNFLRFPTPPAYLDVWNQLYNVVRKLNAWTTTLAGFRTEDHSYNTVVRGGVAYNVTSRSSLMSLEQYREAAVKALQLRHSFDEYLIVSDGAAASASSIFSSAVEQIWKNRDRSGADDAKVTTVSFGGTGDKADLTMAGVPASVEGVRLDNFLYTTISLLLFPLLLPVMEGNLKDDLLDVARSVDDRTYFPPFQFRTTTTPLWIQEPFLCNISRCSPTDTFESFSSGPLSTTITTSPPCTLRRPLSFCRVLATALHHFQLQLLPKHQLSIPPPIQQLLM